MAKKGFIIFVIILAIIAGILGWQSFQQNVYSKEILKLEILGPDSAEILQEARYVVKYKNNGNIRLEELRLIFEYPKYSVLESGKTARQEIALEDIYPGQERTLEFPGRLFGKEGELKVAKAELSYRPKNLTARYISTTSFTTMVAKVPLNFELDLPSKIESGKEIRFRLNYFSNVNYPLSNLRIEMEYPGDFEFLESTPQGLENDEWEIGLLNRTDGGRIEVRGKVSGEIGEEKLFRGKLGSWQDGEFVLLKEVMWGVKIVEPSLLISQQINGNPKYIASPGDQLHYEILFRNIGQNPLTDLYLVADLEGNAFDFGTIKAPMGDFETGDNSVIFDWKNNPKLRFLDVQEQGSVDFWINLKEAPEMVGPQDKNPLLKTKIYLSQTREEFLTRVNSQLEISQKGYFEDEVFGNEGPLPPAVGQTTTYTVIWQVKNYFNDLKNVKVKARLGEGVKPSGKIFPEDASLTFDSQSREMVWSIGDMGAGKGVADSPMGVAFQVAFTPRESQQGKVAILAERIKVEGQDQWTGEVLHQEGAELDTALENGGNLSEDKSIVQ